MPTFPPRLLRSPLTGTVYIVTSYEDLGEGRIRAKVKHDVTAEFEALVAQRQSHLREAARAVVETRGEEQHYAIIALARALEGEHADVRQS